MPSLAPVIDTLDAVPEPVRGFYEQKDGKYALQLSATPAGFVPAADLATANGKVVEFRDTNVALMREVEQLRPLKTAFEGIDPAAAKDAIAKVAELGKKGIKGADDLKTLIDAAVAPIAKRLEDSDKAAVAERKRADDAALRSAVGEKFIKAGGKSGALDFIVGQAAGVFEVKDGKVVAAVGKYSAEKPSEPLGVDEWLAGQARSNDFAFGASAGSGANPKPGDPVLKAGQTLLKNPTPQQLGEFSKDIAKGAVKVVYDNQ